MLKEGEEMLVEWVGLGGFYCPYNNCGVAYKQRSRVLRHLRTIHGRDIPNLIQQKNHSTVLKAPSGQILKFDESSRNILNAGDDILVEKTTIVKNNQVYICPYKNCHSVYAHRTSIYAHIRRGHGDKSFFMGSVVSGRKLIFTNSSGESIHFDDKSKNSVNENERIIVVKC
ncbi:hypothetical protein BDB00DRAFT_845497 [Zychaea mexicana]|uniref:uncharacterized protein n=1 Tax=Zychaea mexicana TaxID=64656 RepID=UPI0022FE059A|nr:uncharacterized protein BDB00DRAFT_845497 [Zychaea mexicana]KAI9489060.1 hypothetical protein BDB00DRAFT_845497 [Zychaea mexicana]